ncbi:MAG TPA: FAD-dependent oxidoreductase [Longimicrobiaceae bacterium]|nr:FAD-dependent oxidoreductase [Longimicrobiaceae bacterium]
MMDVVVLGAGVSGLSTALRLQERGMRVGILTADDPHDTVSAVAAAIWYPYRAYPVDRVAAWSARTYRELAALAELREAGVRMAEGVEIWRNEPPELWSGEGFGEVPRAALECLPAGCAGGHRIRVPVVEMPVYLPYLVGRFLAGGGSIERRELGSLEEAFDHAPRVVNCTGLGARALLDDREMYPIRGQVVRIENPGLREFMLDSDTPEGATYVIPRSTDCILGGTAEEGSWDLRPDPETARAILERCARLVPQVARARVLEHRVGLRPGRSAVRLEAEEIPGRGRVVHNYGHGGAGVTLSWGCAKEAAERVTEE